MNLAAAHNAGLPKSGRLSTPDVQFNASLQARVNSSHSPIAWPAETKAYTALDALPCADGAATCGVLVVYDRLADSDKGPPIPNPSQLYDRVFSMRVDITVPRQQMRPAAGDAAPSKACSIGVNVDATQRRPAPVSGKVAGLLNGLNESQPSAASISPVGMSMWRGPKADWLWNRTGCNGLRTCCTVDSCEPVFSEAARLTSLGLRQQYILDGIHHGVSSCEWHSFHDTPHNCSLPGGPSDPDMKDWEYSVRAAARGALRAGIATPYCELHINANFSRNFLLRLENFP